MTTVAPQTEGSVGPVGGAPPSFNLWNDKWISVERLDGSMGEIGVRDCLLHAHELRSLREASPLAVAGIHRLLTAIAQSLVRPAGIGDVRNLLSHRQFAADAIAAFGNRHGERFDLFSPEAPFMQTNDAPTAPKRAELKPIAYLLPELPTATNVVHWRHVYDGEHRFCPPCAAAGLLTIPPFATSGGAGIKPSINGVPPLYVLPSGSTLFETLALSVLAPPFQPEVRSERDCPIWEGDGHVGRSVEVLSVGYIQSLTFPARRVRLYPEIGSAICTRCGRDTSITVAMMLFEMGLSRPKTAAPWFDPFAAYTLPRDGSSKPPVPVRPREGRALWREYGTLFLSSAHDEKRARPPAVLAQMQSLTGFRVFTLRCVGMRTDMKAKVFEWTDESLQVPSGLQRSRRQSLWQDED
jgi:CRISPR system Cascade subunit CasA